MNPMNPMNPMSLTERLAALVRSKSPIARQLLEAYTDDYMKVQDELTEDESDTIDALLRILEERIVDDESTKRIKEANKVTRRGGDAPREV